MKRFKTLQRTLSITAAACLLCFTIAQAKKPDKPGGGGQGDGSVSYQIVELDDVGGFFGGQAFDINNSRLAVGGVVDDSGPDPIAYAAYWTVTGSGHSLESTLYLLDGGSLAQGCNDAGEIVGVDDDSGNSDAVAMYWNSPNAVGQVLPGLDGDTRWGAEAISEDGVICGWSQLVSEDGQSRRSTAVVWRVTLGVDGPQIWGPLELETFGSDPDKVDFSVGNDASNQDADGIISIVGESNFIAVEWTVTLAENGGLIAETANILAEGGHADATNNSGVICGRANLDTSTPNTEGVVWIDGVGQILQLGRSTGPANPLDVNESGVIVGYSGIGRAVVWANPNSDLIELDRFVKKSPFKQLPIAQAVNDAGEIVGGGWKGDQNTISPFLAVQK